MSGGVITSTSFPKALWPGVQAWYGKSYSDFKTFYDKLFDVTSTNRAYVEDVGQSGFGLAQIKPEGQAITYDTESQAFVTRYNNVTYALGFIITEEMMEDNLYAEVGERRASGLARSMRHTKEVVAHNVYNRAFTAGLGGDGKVLLANDHPNFAGGSYSNILSTAADLSEAALEQACIDIKKYTDDRGLRIAVMPKTLIIPIESEFEAHRILKTDGRVGTANNDTNALKDMGKFPGGVVASPYLDVNNGAWFIRTDVKNGMKLIQRREMRLAEDNDFDTANAKFKASERYVPGWTDPKGLFGSAGVA